MKFSSIAIISLVGFTPLTAFANPFPTCTAQTCTCPQGYIVQYYYNWLQVVVCIKVNAPFVHCDIHKHCIAWNGVKR